MKKGKQARWPLWGQMMVAWTRMGTVESSLGCSIGSQGAREQGRRLLWSLARTVGKVPQEPPPATSQGGPQASYTCLKEHLASGVGESRGLLLSKKSL